MAQNDLQLVKQFKNGDERAFNDLVNSYKKQIYHIILRMIRNSDDAMDLAQDTFIRAYKNINNFKEESSFYTWIYRIAVNLCLNHIKRNKIKSWLSFDEIPKPIKAKKDNPVRETERIELQELINEAVRNLPERQRAIFIMRYYEDMSHKEIAKILDRSEGAVKAGYFHAVKKLQKELAAYERWIG